MQIKKESVVSFHYALSNEDGQLLDTSHGKEPFAYLHGAGMIVPGLEEEMEGKAEGDKFKAVVPPEKGYGTFNMQLLQQVPLDKFGGQKVEEGMQFQAGEHGVFTVKEVKDEKVLLDGNHPLAGVTLNFDVEITEVREATPEELDHGHVHGPGGHHH
ncbi:MAG: peptidylprolyl isomerase [Flavobacteriales bacterium]|nr:peptidylprolyl isomerase [Flavobacteriales bacterium]